MILLKQQKTKKFSMREREHASSSRNKGKISENPGLGQYPPVITINNKGKYPISRIANITLSDFGDINQIYVDNKNPGPNVYELKSLMGQNFNSKYTSSQDKKMLGRYKESDSRENCKIFIDI